MANIVICQDDLCVLPPEPLPQRRSANENSGSMQGHPANVHAIEDVSEVIETYRRACQLAKSAGFDGIELLAQGYEESMIGHTLADH